MMAVRAKAGLVVNRASASRASARRAVTRACIAIALCAAGASAQQTHVLVITGLGGEAQYTTAFRAAGAQLRDVARTKWRVADSSLVLLTEDPAAVPGAQGPSTKDEIGKAFLQLGRRVSPGDIVFVFLVGHGAGEGAESRISIPGPDATAADFGAWLGGFAKQTVVFVNASSGSGDFQRVIAAPQRVIITATRSALERNESLFAGPFVNGFVTGEADADKDGRISAYEAFVYARRETERMYEGANKLMTEHAALSDSLLARTVAFGGAPVSTDPRIAALVAERRALEDSLTALRARKAQTDSTLYERELERLLIAIAEKTQAIRAAGGRD